jgi:hypothetical protein
MSLTKKIASHFKIKSRVTVMLKKKVNCIHTFVFHVVWVNRLVEILEEN